MKLVGKVAIVTGSARGIGKAIAMRFASEGAAVVVDDINIEQAKQVAEEINNQGGTATAIKADVSNRVDVINLVKSTLENYKAIHILVNNAGISRPVPLLKMTEEDWDAVLDVNLKGVFNCTQAVLGHMEKQRYGKIINISSLAGLGITDVRLTSYSAAKAGVNQLTKVTAMEGGPYGINVNCIAPGLIMTELANTFGKEAEKFIEDRRKHSVLGRAGSPDEVANLALFLASDDSSFITGQVIRCDGGRYDLM